MADSPEDHTLSLPGWMPPEPRARWDRPERLLRASEGRSRAARPCVSAAAGLFPGAGAAEHGEPGNKAGLPAPHKL